LDKNDNCAPIKPPAPTRLSTKDRSVGGNRGRMDLGMYFDWSPNGAEIAFADQRSGRSNDWTTQKISIVNVDNKKIRHLDTAADAAASQPLFSPDGKNIALVISDAPARWGFARRVYTVPAAGGTPTPLAETVDRQPSLVGWSLD